MKISDVPRSGCSRMSPIGKTYVDQRADETCGAGQLLPGRQEPRQRHDDGQLGELRRLELHGSHDEPAARALDAGGKQGHRGQDD